MSYIVWGFFQYWLSMYCAKYKHFEERRQRQKPRNFFANHKKEREK
jgi:hypothetical protein